VKAASGMTTQGGAPENTFIPVTKIKVFSDPLLCGEKGLTTSKTEQISFRYGN